MSYKSIFVDNLHNEVTEEMLKQKFSVIGKVSSVHIHLTKHRCYAYINFCNSNHASQAVKTMNNDVLKDMPMQIKPNKMDPALEDAKNSNIYIKYLDKSITQDQLKDICCKYGKILSLKIPSNEKGSQGYAYVNFSTEKEALQAIKNLNGRKVGGKQLSVEKYKPPNERGKTSTTNISWHNDREISHVVGTSSPVGDYEADDYEVDDQKGMFQFVEKSPTIRDAKLRYLRSMLCSKYKEFCNKKINKELDKKKARGRLASVSGNILLVTCSEDEHINCCQILSEMIHCSVIKIPSSLGEKINLSVLAKNIKAQKLKYLGLSVVKNDVEVGSFNKIDLEKGKEIVEKLIENFQSVCKYSCSETKAKLLHKEFSSKLSCGLSIISGGLKLVGDTTAVLSAKHQLDKKKVVDDGIKFAAPKLSTFFNSLQWIQIVEELESNFNCVVSKEKVSANISQPMTQFSVYHGNIVDDSSDAIVNGVSGDFDLTWGKISPAILARAGNSIVSACSSNPLVSTPYVRATKAGNLSCKYIFHMVTPSSCDELTKRIRIVLDEAEKFGVKSISFPTLGAGGIGLEVIEVALAMKKAFDGYVNGGSGSLDKISIAVFEPSLTPIFEQHAVPSDNAAFSQSLAAEVICDHTEHYDVTITCLAQSDLNQVIRYLKKLRSSLIIEEEISKNPSKLEKFDKFEIAELGSKHGMAIKIIKNGSKKLVLCGLSRNVKPVKDKVDSIFNELHSASVIAKLHLWKREDNSGKFVSFPLRLSRLIEIAYENSPNSVITVSECGVSYTVDLKSRTFTSSFSFSSGKILREDRSSSGVPDDWLPMNGEAMIRHQLAVDSAEYTKVLSRFKQSGLNYTVIKIERVQNPTLYEQYLTKKRDVEKNMKRSGPVERELFHGTSKDAVDKICADGFDRGFCGKNGTALGKGVYFHVKSSYSAQYSEPSSSNTKYMFLATVLTGNYCKGDRSFKAPPPMGFGGSLRLYDSVVDDINSPSMFVVFKDASVYPKYLISFQ